MDTKQNYNDKIEDRILHDNISATYDNKYRYKNAQIFFDYEVHELLKMIETKRGILLDVGCGTGVLLPHASKYCDIYIGLDQSKGMIQSAIQKYGKTSFLICDGEKLPFKEGSINTIVCRGSLHHMINTNLALNEFSRVLDKGGRLVMAEPNRLNPLIRSLRFIMTKFDRGYSSKQKQFNPMDLISLLKENDFIEISFRYIGYFSNLFERPDYVIISKYTPSSVFRKVIEFDEYVSKISFINKASWGLIVTAVKK